MDFLQVVTFLFSSFLSAANGAEHCSVGQELFKDPDEVATFAQKINAKIEGELGTCDSLLGIYKRDEAGKPRETLQVSKFQPNQLILLKGAKSYEAVLKVETLSETGTKVSDGVAVLDRGQWTFVYVTDPNKSEIQSLYPEGAAFGAYEKFKATGQLPVGTRVETFEFSADRASGKSSSSTLTFDDDATLKSRTADSSAFRTAGLLAPNEETRIHRDMYSLLDTPEFKRAKANDNFTGMVDLIWAHALKVAKGNKVEALYLSLLVTDLRTRGPCGSFYGKRGREIVPTTIFDGEKPTLLKENRLDALQHFFGYALIQNNEGQKVAEFVSRVSKDKDFYAPRFANFTRSFHSTRTQGEPVVTEGAVRALLWTDLTSPYWEGERARNDIEIDKFYNKMGIEFGRRLNTDIRTKPSAIINDDQYDQERKKLGLASASSRDWIAVDPALEVPKRNWKPPEKRNMDLAFLSYEGAADCGRSSAFDSSCSSGIKAASAVCENAVTANASLRACKMYRDAMLALMMKMDRQKKDQLARERDL